MTENREQEALGAYLKLLQNKGASEASLEQRKEFLLKLVPSIVDLPNHGFLYRDAVEDFLEGIDKAKWAFCLAVAREYFPFWTKDIKAIAALNSDAAFDVDPVQWQTLECDLKVVWASLKNEKFSHVDTLALKAYTTALNKKGADKALVETRIKLVKLLLLRLKDVTNKNAKIYRKAADATLPVFEIKEMRYLFLIVVREFYYFWIGDPNAADNVLDKT